MPSPSPTWWGNRIGIAFPRWHHQLAFIRRQQLRCRIVGLSRSATARVRASRRSTYTNNAPAALQCGALSIGQTLGSTVRPFGPCSGSNIVLCPPSGRVNPSCWAVPSPHFSPTRFSPIGGSIEQAGEDPERRDGRVQSGGDGHRGPFPTRLPVLGRGRAGMRIRCRRTLSADFKDKRVLT